MTNEGMGVMIHALSGAGHESGKAVRSAIGKRIVAVALVSDVRGLADELRLSLDDGATLVLWDDGQSCCEARYMRTDDDREPLTGGLCASCIAWGEDSHRYERKAPDAE